jgi:hypothetical protein
MAAAKSAGVSNVSADLAEEVAWRPEKVRIAELDDFGVSQVLMPDDDLTGEAVA